MGPDSIYPENQMPVRFGCDVGCARDPRATMNAIYYPDAVRVLLRLAKAHDVPLLFVTNNVCNQLLKFENAEEVAEQLGLQPGLLRKISDAWFNVPHLKGRAGLGVGECSTAPLWAANNARCTA
jgi:hypothetical protein